MKELSAHPAQNVPYLRLYLLITLVNVGSNALTFLGINMLRLYMSGAWQYGLFQQAQKQAIENGTIIPFLLISFGVPTLAGISYFAPIIRVQWISHRGYNPSARIWNTACRWLLNAPFLQGLIAFLGWTIGSILSFQQLGRIESSVGVDFYAANALGSVLFSFFTFVNVYYSLEWIVRRFFIKYFFPDGRVSHITGVINPSVRMRFLLLFAAICVFPVTLYALILSNVTFDGAPFPVSIASGSAASLVFLGFLATWFIASSYQTPLREMTHAAAEIGQGNLKIRVPVRSNDESGILAETVNRMAVELEEKQRLHETFGRIVDPTVRDHLMQSDNSAQKLEVSVLFSDIRGFTTLSEAMAPEDITNWLNRYFAGVSRIIRDHGGMIDKFIGDAVMAIFGAPVQRDDHARRAVQAAIAMERFRKEISDQFLSEGLPELRTGTGIHSGAVVAGPIGSSDRMEYTVVGDTVNLASRLEGLTPKLQKKILISESTASSYDGPVRKLGFARVKGRKERILVYEVLL
ncbi:MAG: adenylate/guanylate cyclase domain-containing protein [Leptospiraceae bacterium]|nr:adenylate/guanylate cyclase domain-containing protein [Leptospiraceae bacterium]